jgi:hypothetical protein
VRDWQSIVARHVLKLRTRETRSWRQCVYIPFLSFFPRFLTVIQVDPAQDTESDSQSDYQRAFYAMKVRPLLPGVFC